MCTVKKSRILALDCSTERISLSLCGQDMDLDGGPKASGHLLAGIQGLMRAQGLTLTALDAIAYGRGPGAFTGLRTALAVAQGLAFAAQLPLIGVDGLQALAFAAHERSQARYIVAALDARMGEIYSAEYDWLEQVQNAYQKPQPVQLVSASVWHIPPGFLVAGNCGGNHDCPQASAMACIAAALLQAGASVPANQATLHYVRNKVARTTHERALHAQSHG